jgi:molybdopterin synthase sulfur carrier subunit
MAKVEVFIPGILRRDKNKSKVTAEASNLKELLEYLDKNNLIAKEKLFDEKGQIRRLLNIYINGKIETDLNKNLKEGDEVSFIPAVAGG